MKVKKKVKVEWIRNRLQRAMSEVRWQGKTGGGVGVNAKSLAPCARALAFGLERIGGLQSE